MRPYRYLSDPFADHAAIYRTGLSHRHTLLVVANLSLFFVTRLVIDEGYDYTFYSRACLIIVAGASSFPRGL